MGNKKYVVVLGDGMADEPIEALGGKTPLEYADTPAMDRLSKRAEMGMVQTIPEGMKPGSDTANLSVLGYDPIVYYSGRSPPGGIEYRGAHEGYGCGPAVQYCDPFGGRRTI